MGQYGHDRNRVSVGTEINDSHGQAAPGQEYSDLADGTSRQFPPLSEIGAHLVQNQPPVSEYLTSSQKESGS